MDVWHGKKKQLWHPHSLKKFGNHWSTESIMINNVVTSMPHLPNNDRNLYLRAKVTFECFQPVTVRFMGGDEDASLCSCHTHLDPILPARDMMGGQETEEPLKHLPQSDIPALTFSVKFHLTSPSNTDPQATSTTLASTTQCYSLPATDTASQD